MEIEKIAKAWIEMWSYEVNAPERDNYEWVEDFEYEATHEKPENGLKMILEILAHNPNDRVIEVLAAGPLEDLLAYHGETIIEKIEEEAESNKSFANLLGGVWQNMMPNHIWERIQKVWDRSDWDGKPKA